MLLSLGHVVITFSDWARSNPFYGDLVGAEVLEAGPDRVAYRFGARPPNVDGRGSEPSARACAPVAPLELIAYA